MFFTFLLPILLILLFGAIFTNNNSTISVSVQNLDGGAASSAFLDALNHTGVLKVELIPSNADFNQYAKDNSLSIAIQIPANFTSDVEKRTNDKTAAIATVIMYGDPSQSTYQMVQGAANGAVQSMNFDLANTTAVIAIRSQSLPNAHGYTYMDYFLTGIIGMNVMTVSLYGMTNLCSNYRSKGYFKLLATTKIQKYEWMVTKFIVYAVILTISLLVTYSIGVLAFGMTSELTPLTFAFIIAGCFLFISLGMLIGVGIKDEESGVAIANAIGFPMMFLSGCFFSIGSFPSFLQGVSAVLPLTYLNNGLRDTMVYGNEASALFNLAIVVIVGVILMVLASRIMSWKEE
jgi:ABC-2 type transport system permease protein